MSLLALRLTRPAKNEDMCIVDLYPDLYQTIPDSLLISACAYVCFMVLRASRFLTFIIDSMYDALAFCWVSDWVFEVEIDLC